MLVFTLHIVLCFHDIFVSEISDCNFFPYQLWSKACYDCCLNTEYKESVQWNCSALPCVPVLQRQTKIAKCHRDYQLYLITNDTFTVADLSITWKYLNLRFRWNTEACNSRFTITVSVTIFRPVLVTRWSLLTVISAHRWLQDKLLLGYFTVQNTLFPYF